MLIVEISEEGDEHRLFRVTYDGTLYDERRFVAIGGKAEQLVEALQELWEDDLTLERALEIGTGAFRRAEGGTWRVGKPPSSDFPTVVGRFADSLQPSSPTG